MHLVSKHFEKPKRKLITKHGTTAHLGQDEAVIVGVAGIFGFVAHGVEEQHWHELGSAAAWGGVPVNWKSHQYQSSHHSSNMLDVKDQSDMQVIFHFKTRAWLQMVLKGKSCYCHHWGLRCRNRPYQNQRLQLLPNQAHHVRHISLFWCTKHM